jgi:hypothetical protein
MLTLYKGTYALLDIPLLVFSTVDVIIEHGLQVGVMAFIAWPLVVDRVGEEGVEAETNQEGFAYLHHHTSLTSEFE